MGNFNSYAQFSIHELQADAARCTAQVSKWFPLRHTRYEVRVWLTEARRARAALAREVARRSA